MRHGLLGVLLCLLLWIPSLGMAAERYVATTGNDTTGDGSLEFPYRTTVRAFEVALLRV